MEGGVQVRSVGGSNGSTRPSIYVLADNSNPSKAGHAPLVEAVEDLLVLLNPEPRDALHMKGLPIQEDAPVGRRRPAQLGLVQALWGVGWAGRVG